MSGLSVVYYFCPEDGEDASQPNAFGLQKPLSAIDYKDIVDSFPLRGEYVFRAKFKQGKEVLWLDLDRFAGKIPSDDGAIWLKIKRVTWNDRHATKQSNKDQDESLTNGKPKPESGSNKQSNTSTPNPPHLQAHGNSKTAKQPSFDFQDITHGFGQPADISTKHPKVASPQANNIIDLDIDLSGMGTSSIQTPGGKQAASNMMEDFLL